MKIDFTQELTDLGDEDTKPKDIGSLKTFCVGALLNGCFGDEKANSEAKVKRFELALKIKFEDDLASVGISAEDVVLIKESLSNSVKQYTPLVIGQVARLLEGKKIFPSKDKDAVPSTKKRPRRNNSQ